LVFSLQWTRDVLHNRIAARVKQMFERGLVGEVQQLVQTFGSLSRTAAQAVGYREVLAHLADEISLDQTREQVLFHTRQLARRQETWLRSLQEVRVVSRSEEDSSEKIAQKITDCIREHGGLVGAFQLPV
jgi:tRNA dimethylallyltransferase